MIIRLGMKNLKDIGQELAFCQHRDKLKNQNPPPNFLQTPVKSILGTFFNLRV
jgi:hypothetical protein